MKTFLSLLIVGALVGGSIYLFLNKPAPQKYIDLVSVAQPTISEEDPIKILFVGDIMLDRSIRNIIDQNGFDYILKDVNIIFSDTDLTMGNLEGTITHNDSISIVNNKILHFTFATSTALSLKKAGFDGFSLANNHALDFYQAGFDETASNLKSSNLFFFGHPLNNQILSNTIEVKNKNICFVGYHSLYSASTTNVLNEIKEMKPGCDFVSVFAHWGNEYEDFENEEQQSQAHSFIDVGADLVIGAHPHVIQPIEIYKNKAIFYSLGNFIFDQDFSLRTRQGIAVKVILNKEKTNYEIIPIEMEKGRLYFPEQISFKERLNVLTSKLPAGLSNSILSNHNFSLSY